MSPVSKLFCTLYSNAVARRFDRMFEETLELLQRIQGNFINQYVTLDYHTCLTCEVCSPEAAIERDDTWQWAEHRALRTLRPNVIADCVEKF